MANRYSQRVQPLVVNPISIDTFSRVPLAKASAEAAGIAAANSLEIDYNVDDKDKELVGNMVGALDTKKEAAVNRVMEEGISDDFVSDFIQMRKQYKGVKQNVRIAEENKSRIDIWRADVAKRHNNGQYAQYVVDQEYAKGWAGTFGVGVDGKPTTETFQKHTGPKQHSLRDDLANAMKSAPIEIKDDIARGGRFVMQTDPNGKEYMVYRSKDPNSTGTNAKQVEALMNSVLAEYADPTSAKGAYAAYTNLNPETIQAVADFVQEGYTVNNKSSGRVTNRVMPDAVSDDEVVEPALVETTLINKQEGYVPTPEYINQAVAAGNAKKAAKKQGRSKWWNEKSSNFRTTMYKGLFKWSPAARERWNYKLKDIKRENINKQNEENIDVKEAYFAGQEVIDSIKNELSINYALAEAAGVDMSNAGSDDLFIKSFSNTAHLGIAQYDTKFEKELANLTLYADYNSTRYKDSELVTNRVNPAIEGAVGVRNNVKSIGLDLHADGPAVKIMMLGENDKRILNEDDSETYSLVSSALDAGGAVPPRGAPGFRAKINGTSTGDTNLYSLKDENGEVTVPEGLAFGTVVDLIYYDKNGKQNPELNKKILVGPKHSSVISEEYKALENKVITLGELVPGNTLSVTVPSVDARGNAVSLRGGIEATKVGSVALNDDNEEVWVPLGTKVLHTGNGATPRIMNANHLDKFTIMGEGSGELTSIHKDVLQKRYNDLN